MFPKLSTRFLSICIVLFVSAFATCLTAQKPTSLSSSEIYHKLLKLNTLAKVLYIAAHPDDENTRLISYFSNSENANTAYLSLTRGDGGQNLIGKEIGPMLGVLRTQELLQARSIDGGQQFFSRAIDFGYSKHPDETLRIWNKDEVLSDVVRIIRQFQPDIIINRFDHRTPGKTHGHHTSSAVLSLEAFDLANDKSAYKEQLSKLEVWQPRRVYYNTSWWAYGGRDAFAKADKSNLMSVDIGSYLPLKGKSNTEIGAEARSMHKCQGFGSAGTRSSRQEFLELLKGDVAENKNNVFDGMDITWSRIKGGDSIKKALNEVIQAFDFVNPSKHLDALVSIYSEISKLEDSHWKEIKRKELTTIIEGVAGLYISANTDVQSAAIGDSIEIKIEVTNRSNEKLILKKYGISKVNINEEVNIPLPTKEEQIKYHSIKIPKTITSSNPYWLNEKGTFGMYKVSNENNIGKPENESTLKAIFQIQIKNTLVEFTKDVPYVHVEPSIGEISEPFNIINPVSIDIMEDAYIFSNNESQQVVVEIVAGKKNIKGDVRLKIPDGWNCTPNSYEYALNYKGEKTQFTFELKPPSSLSQSLIIAEVSNDGNWYNQSKEEIIYDHIPSQICYLAASAKVVRVPLTKKGKNDIGYIMGAGDVIPEALQSIGYNVTLLDPDQGLENLDKYQAIIIGIRAYNVVESLPLVQDKLFAYAKTGGNLITQYNTTWRLKTKTLTPFNLQLSRDRVSQENAEVTILKSEHESMIWPNKLNDQDWENWVQERGLYFPDEWDESFEAILSMHDINETPKEGSLLIAPYGDGQIVYTGLSFFRELPAGVPGAYRLLVNLISLGTYEK